MVRLPSGALLLVACVLAVGALSAPVATAHLNPAETPAPQSAEDGPSYESPDDDSVTGEDYETVSLNLGAAVQADAQALRTEHERQVFAEELEAANTDSARTFVAEERYETLVSRYERLDEREQELIEGYGNGELTTGLLLSELVNLQTTLQAQVTLREQARTESSTPVPERLWNFEGALAVDAPIVDRVATAQRSFGDSEPFYILSGEESLALATVDDQTFLRQATVREGRDLTVGREADQFRTEEGDNIEEASDRAADLYPWIFAQNLRESALAYPEFEGTSKVYLVGATYSEGTLTTYLDGATTNVFHEIHEQPISRIEFTGSVSNESGTLNVTVERTSETGPMRVTATNSESGIPIEGVTVEIAETTVGTTDSDGRLWAVEPRIASEVSVSTDDGDTVIVSL